MEATVTWHRLAQWDIRHPMASPQLTEGTSTTTAGLQGVEEEELKEDELKEEEPKGRRRRSRSDLLEIFYMNESLELGFNVVVLLWR